MNYRLFVTDLDGTLLDDKKHISVETIDAIKKLYDKKVLFAVATGRAPRGIRRIIEEFSFDIPCICFNGALIITSKSNENVFEQTLEPNDALKVISLLNDDNYSFVVWKKHEVYSSKLSPEIISYANRYETVANIVTDFTPISQLGIHKILVTAEEDKIITLQHKLQQMQFLSLDFYPSSANYLEIVNSKTSKGIALEIIQNKYSISPNETIVIGDSYNDLSMFEKAGLKIAMENAPLDIKKHADIIAKSNNEDGVCKIIKEIFFK